MRPRVALTAMIILATLLAAGPASAISYGTAQGTVLAGGERFELTHAYAVHRNSVFDPGGGGEKTRTLVRLVDGEVASEAVSDDKKFAKAIADGKLHAIEVELKDESGEILRQRLYDGPKVFDGEGGDAGTWLRGEYNNKVIWGALATDGVQPYGEQGFWRFEAFFAAQFQAPPAAALDENTASGSFTLAGKSAKLTHARAWLDDQTPEGGESETFTVLVLSSGPLDLETAKDEARLLAAVKKQKIQAFKVRINDQQGNIAHQAWITAAGVQESEPDENLRWASWQFDTDTITGMVTSDGERQAGKTKWSIAASFNAKIAGAPTQE